LKAHFAMFKCLLAAGGDFLTITNDNSSNKLHIWRCTADVKECREYYVQLTEPTGVYLEWRRIMLAKQTARQVFVQPNTYISGGEVFLKEYEPTVEGMIQSWAERMRMIGQDMEK